MNIYKENRFSEPQQTPEHLAEEAWHFANTLAAGRWRQQGIRKVEVTRSIMEALGEESELSDYMIEPIYDEVTISFLALKRYLEDEDGDAMVPHYTITSTVSQDVDKSEIPSGVIEEIIESAADNEHHPLRELAEDDEDESTVFTSESLEEFEIRRTQEVEYLVDYQGKIEDYTLSYSYSLDDATVHEVAYTDSNSEVIWHPIRLADGSVRERKPIALLALNEASLQGETKDIDTAFEAFMFKNDARDLIEFNALPDKEHTRRLLGMISMVSDGYIDFRKTHLSTTER